MAITYNTVGTIIGGTGTATGGQNVTTIGNIGDQNIAWMSVNGGNLTLKSIWNVGNTYADANGSSGWFWIPNLGVGASIVVDWGATSQTWHCQASAFTGANYIPFGAYNSGHGTTTPLTVASLTTQKANSLVMANQLIFVSNQVIPLPSPYTNIAQFNGDSIGSDRISYETLGAAGSASDLASSAITAANWNSHGIELISSIASAYPYPTQVSPLLSGTGTTVSPPGTGLPTLAGDLCLALCIVNAAGQTITVSGTGWSILQQDTTNGLSVALASSVSTGATANNLTFSWGASNSYAAETFGYRQNKASAPIGANSVSVGNSATASSAGLTTTAASSLVLLIGATTANGMFSQNPNYYIEQANAASGVRSWTVQDAQVANSGTTTTAYSQPFVGAVTQPWKIFMVEVLAANPQVTTTVLIGQTTGAI